MDFDVVIIGGGVVGLACAAESARRGFGTLLVERHPSFGNETSSRNSEVIHAGIYYAKDSLKARWCVQGREMLYAYAQERGVPHQRCGKLIVATQTGEIAQLEQLLAHGQANGVDDLRLIDQSEALRLEPQLQCAAALLSPSTREQATEDPGW